MCSGGGTRRRRGLKSPETMRAPGTYEKARRTEGGELDKFLGEPNRSETTQVCTKNVLMYERITVCVRLP